MKKTQRESKNNQIDNRNHTAFILHYYVAILSNQVNRFLFRLLYPVRDNKCSGIPHILASDPWVIGKTGKLIHNKTTAFSVILFKYI